MVDRQTGGGAATTAGVDFQQRVAAYFLATMITDLDIADVSGGPTGSPQNLAFESREPIDDLNILTTSSCLYVQIKRTLQYSKNPNSEFGKVLDQFAAQHQKQQSDRSECFVLVCSPSSSRTITDECKTVLDLIRLDPKAASPINSNLQRQKLFTELCALAEQSLTKSGTKPDLQQARDLLSKIRIYVLDIEKGRSLENALFLALSRRIVVNPTLFWDHLISDCLWFSTNRASVDRNAALDRYKHYFIPANDDERDATPTGFFDFVLHGDFQVAKEVIVGTKIGDGWQHLEEMKGINDPLIIMELHRFDSQCQKRIRFVDGTCILKSGLNLLVQFRSATWSAANRFVETQLHSLKERGLLLLPARETDSIETSSCANLHRDLCKDQLKKRSGSTACLHCNKAISTNDGLLIELDEENLKFSVGLIHSECRRPLDRVTGTIHNDFFDTHPHLRNFNSALWFSRLPQGQGVFRASSEVGAKLIHWAGDTASLVEKNYCVKFELPDGEVEYAFKRGRLHRLDRADAEKFSSELNDLIQKHAKAGDPICFSAESRGFGPKSFLLEQLGAKERLRECLAASTVKYSLHIETAYRWLENWYAPVCFLRTLQTDEVFAIKDAVVLLTDPFALDRFLENWRSVQIETPSFEIYVVGSDVEFDDFAREIFARGRFFLVDPIFGDGLELLSGSQMIDIEQMRALAEHRQGKAKKSRGPRGAGRS